MDGTIGVKDKTVNQMLPFIFNDWLEFKIMTCINNFSLITKNERFNQIKSEIFTHKSKWIHMDDMEWSETSIALMRSRHAMWINDELAKLSAPQRIMLINIWEHDPCSEDNEEDEEEDEDYEDDEDDEDCEDDEGNEDDEYCEDEDSEDDEEDVEVFFVLSDDDE